MKDQAGNQNLSEEGVLSPGVKGLQLSLLESKGFWSNLTNFFKNIFGLITNFLGNGRITGNVIKGNETG